MITNVVKHLNQALLLLMAAAMLDTCVAAARTPSHRFAVVSGEEIPVSGKLAAAVIPPPENGTLFAENRITDPVQLAWLLRVEPVTPGIGFRFVERNGRMWRAVLRVGPGVGQGEYHLHVLQPGETPNEKNRYRLAVYPDAAAKRGAAPSWLLRYLGVQPWWVALGLLPAAVAMLACSWRNARRQEACLRARGLGVIYKLARRKDGWELIAGLGTADGVRAGEEILLLSKERTPVATLRVLSAAADHLTAEVGLEVAVKPDGYVARIDPGSKSSFAVRNR
jgi:hypothetical protein